MDISFLEATLYQNIQIIIKYVYFGLKTVFVYLDSICYTFLNFFKIQKRIKYGNLIKKKSSSYTDIFVSLH